MRTRSIGVVIATAFVLTLLSPSSQGATLTLSPAASLFDSGNTFFLGNLGVSASVGGDPIPPAGYPGPSTGVATGSMSLTPVGAGDQADLRFSVSLFSDASPYVLTGSYGPSGVPVVLRINEISFEVTASSDPPARVPLTPQPAGPFPGQVVAGLSASGTIRGSLSVGATTVPFSDTETGCCGLSDASTPAGLDFGLVSLRRTSVGFGGGPGIISSFGVGFPGQDLLTVDGVTFSTTSISPSFYDLLFVPEPSSIALLAVAGLSLLLFTARCLSPG